ncbi:hypothetical protein BGW41_007388, partial [Actinomortierella wolfii]
MSVDGTYPWMMLPQTWEQAQATSTASASKTSAHEHKQLAAAVCEEVRPQNRVSQGRRKRLAP